jgi:nitrogen fixation protein NifU and related proteins
MNQDLKKLYPEILKAHNQAPYHFEKIDSADKVIKAYNPICGDRFEVYLDFENENMFGQLHFYGLGCSVSKASTSVLTKLLEGKTVDDALQLCNHFLSYINQESGFEPLVLPDEFFAFSGVHDFPERLECAALAWREMKKFLESMRSEQ